MDGSLCMTCAKLLCHYIINTEQKTCCIWCLFFSAIQHFIWVALLWATISQKSFWDFLVAKINDIPKCKSCYGFIQKNIHTFYKITICKAVGERIQNSVCCIFSICAKLGLLWQPESHPVPVAMVEKAWEMTFVQHRETSSTLRVLRHSSGNVFLKRILLWKEPVCSASISFINMIQLLYFRSVPLAVSILRSSEPMLLITS